MKLTTKIVDMLHEDFLILQHLITFDAQFKSAKTFTAWLTENNLKRAFEYAQAIADANWHTQVVMAHDVENLEARGYTDYAKVSQALMANIFTKYTDFLNAQFLLTTRLQLAIQDELKRIKQEI